MTASTRSKPDLCNVRVYLIQKNLCLFILFSTLFSGIWENVNAQPYVEGGNTRFRFAQLYLGAEIQYITSDGSTLYFPESDANLKDVNFPASLTPRFTIGGIHFWGHVDFYVTFPLSFLSIGNTIDDGRLKYNFENSVGFGARYFHWRIEERKLRPFIGTSWSLLGYRQKTETEDDEAAVGFHRLPLNAGIVWYKGNTILEIGAEWLPDMKVDYPISRTVIKSTSLPSTNVWLGFKYVFDTTVGLEPLVKQGKIKDIERKYRKEGKLNSFTAAIGPSSAFPLSVSSYNRDHRPFLADRIQSAVGFIDYAIGYYHHDRDLQINVSYRPIKQEQSAYGVKQELERHTLGIEMFKFLAPPQNLWVKGPASADGHRGSRG